MMVSLRSLLLFGSSASLAFSAASCPPSKCKGRIPSQIAAALKGYGPAETYCSSKYPVPVQTCSAVAPTQTISSTVSTVTTTTTVGTTTQTVTGTTSTIIEATTSTPTSLTTTVTTVTETAGAPAGVTKRAYRDARESKLCSLKSQASSYVGAVCTCLETPRSVTVTSTPRTTTRVTATATQSVTATTTQTTTPSTTIITTIFADPVTSTITQTSTTTVQPPSPTQTFKLVVQYQPAQQPNANIYGYTRALNGQAYFIDFTSDPTAATTFTLDGTTSYVSALNGPAAGDMAFYSETVGSSSFVLVTTQTFAATQGGTQTLCSIDSTTQELHCQFHGQDAAFWLCGGHLNLVSPGYDFSNSCNAGQAFQVGVGVVRA